MNENDSVTWLQAQLSTTAENCDLLEEIFYSLGAVSTTLSDSEDQPILEPGVGQTPLWLEVTLTALFSADDFIQEGVSACQVLESHITSHLSQEAKTAFSDLSVTPLENKNWERECLDQFKPIVFRNRLRVCPSWDYRHHPDYIDILLDPGLAFGTGSHPTTQMCLDWLDGCDLTGKNVIDFGCGSGILGIAAIKLGASQVTFIDNDPQAIRASEENLRRNEISSDRYQLICNAATSNNQYKVEQARLAATADIVLANILAQPLIDLSDTISGYLKAGGQIVLSGLLEDQQSEVSTAYRSSFGSFCVLNTEGWLRLDAEKR